MSAAVGRTSASATPTASTSPAVTGANAQPDTSCRLAEPAWVRWELFATYSRDTRARRRHPCLGSADGFADPPCVDPRKGRMKDAPVPCMGSWSFVKPGDCDLAVL